MSASIAATVATVLIALALIAIFTLLDRWAIVGSLGLVYFAVFLLMRGSAPVASSFLVLASGFFVLVILGMSLRQSNFQHVIRPARHCVAFQDLRQPADKG